MAICQSQQQDHARAQLSQRISAWLGEVSTEQAEPQKRKRALQEMSGNIITTPRPRKRTKDGGQQDTSALPVQDDTTPRAAPFPLGDVVAPPGSPSTPHAPSSSSNASAEASSTTASSLKRKRGSSPVKRMAALRHADHGVERHSIQRWKDLPMAMQPLAKQMRDCGRCIALITPVERELFEYIAEGEDDDDQRLLDPTRARIGTSPAVAVLDRIRAHAEENMQLLRSEAAWNCNVHAPLFDQASMCSVYANTVRWENITTATIEPSSLLPTFAATERLPSKKADFALTLRLPRETEKKLAQAGIVSLNQTSYEPLRYSPVAVSFETKLTGENWDTAQLQLNTWALAQVAHLRTLLSKAGSIAASIPPLPLVVIQGKSWTFMYLEVREPISKLWDGIPIATTDSPRGMYQVVTALQLLICWAEEIYRPWFQENILDRLIEAI